jgi:hypothetical protein
MSKNSIWLEFEGDRVLVDVDSPADQYWRSLGYYVDGETAPEPLGSMVEKPARKTRAKKSTENLHT